MTLTNIEAKRYPEFTLIQEVYIGSLEDPNDIDQAVKTIKEGGIVAAQMRGVFGLFIDASNEQAAQQTLQAKKTKDLAKPFAVISFTEKLIEHVDFEVLPECSRQLLSDITDFQDRLGTMCHVRLPISNKSLNILPSRLVKVIEEVPTIINLDPTGHKPMSNFIRVLNNAGIDYVAVTSQGESGSQAGEITDLNQAENFCSNSNISLLLRDPTHINNNIQGSFAMINLWKLTAERDGHIPVDLIQQMLGFEIDLDQIKQTKHPQFEFENFKNINYPPKYIREAILLWLDGTLIVK